MNRIIQGGKRNLEQRGFTLVEAVMALCVLAFGILGLAVVYAQGIAYTSMAQMDYIAEKKAEEAVESIYSARNAQQLSWNQIQNTTSCAGAVCGVFLAGPQPLLAPGPDGIVGTADDDTNNPDRVITGPGPDGKLGTADDLTYVLSGPMRRTIVISNLPLETNVRQITITVTYTVGNTTQRSYTLISYISAFA